MARIKQQKKLNCVCGSKMVNLRTLWRKMKKKKKKRFFRGSSPTVHHLQYDIDSYSKNLDDGDSSGLDNAYSSSSVRFAMLDYSKLCEEISSEDDTSSEMSC